MTFRLLRAGVAQAVAGLALLLSAALTQADTVGSADGAWLDRVVGSKVGGDGTPGAAAAIVRADGTHTLRAWGNRGPGPGQAVDPLATVFRIGSITKTFTAVAVLQLVDEGRVRLDDDVNLHLKGVVVPRHGAVLRVRDLLGHRAGLDGDITFVGLDDADVAARSSDEALQRDIHGLRTPGSVPSYDNMAYGLLGHLLASVDGVPYPQAIQRRILQPLGMTQTQVGLPADAALVARAYEVGPDGKPSLRPHIHLRRGWQGAGDMSSTAADMARYLAMWLAEGRYERGRLLRPETFRLLTDTKAASLVPGLPGMGLGVYALGRPDGGGYGHGGTIRGFNALMMVMPAEGVALFVVMNLNRPAPEMTLPRLLGFLAAPPGRGPIDPTSWMLFELPLLAERQWQQTDVASTRALALPATAEAAASARRWVGNYADLRFQTQEGLMPRLAAALLLPALSVQAAADGGLTIDGQGPYVPIGPGLFALASGQGGVLDRLVGFGEIDGQAYAGPHHLLLGRRLAGWEPIWLTAGGLFIAPLLLGMLALLRRPLGGQQASSRTGFDAGMLLSLIVLLVALLLELSFATELERVYDQTLPVVLWRVAGHVALLMVLWRLVSAWRLADGWRSHLYPSIGAICWLWMTWAAGYWNVLGRF
jgi:CubicO group peptidase (beta-lactamase class C family)